MITTLVQFPLATALSREQATALFAQIVETYFHIPGLVRKYFLLSQDGTMLGGVYLWRSRQDAENFYTPTFHLAIQEKFGSEPTITYFESPVIVDNLRGEAIVTG